MRNGRPGRSGGGSRARRTRTLTRRSTTTSRGRGGREAEEEEPEETEEEEPEEEEPEEEPRQRGARRKARGGARGRGAGAQAACAATEAQAACATASAHARIDLTDDPRGKARVASTSSWLRSASPPLGCDRPLDYPSRGSGGPRGASASGRINVACGSRRRPRRLGVGMSVAHCSHTHRDHGAGGRRHARLR